MLERTHGTATGQSSCNLDIATFQAARRSLYFRIFPFGYLRPTYYNTVYIRAALVDVLPHELDIRAIMYWVLMSAVGLWVECAQRNVYRT